MANDLSAATHGRHLCQDRACHLPSKTSQSSARAAPVSAPAWMTATKTTIMTIIMTTVMTIMAAGTPVTAVAQQTPPVNYSSMQSLPDPCSPAAANLIMGAASVQSSQDTQTQLQINKTITNQPAGMDLLSQCVGVNWFANGFSFTLPSIDVLVNFLKRLAVHAACSYLRQELLSLQAQIMQSLSGIPGLSCLFGFGVTGGLPGLNNFGACGFQVPFAGSLRTIDSQMQPAASSQYPYGASAAAARSPTHDWDQIKDLFQPTASQQPAAGK